VYVPALTAALILTVELAVGDAGLRERLVEPVKVTVRPVDATAESVTGTVPVKLLSGPPERETETYAIAEVLLVVLTVVVVRTSKKKLPSEFPSS
jgi:hypothetical protein